MKRIQAYLAMTFAVLISLCGCGSNGYSVSGSSTSSTATGMTPGNWVINTTSNQNAYNSSAKTVAYSGILQDSSNTLSMVAKAVMPFSPYSAIYTIAGSFDQGSATLSVPVSSSVTTTITGSVANNTYLGGTYQTVTASGASSTVTDSGTVNGVYIPPLTGSWTGSLTETVEDDYGNVISGPNTTSVTVTLQQGSGTQTLTFWNGKSYQVFPLSGSFSAPGSLCYSSGTIQSSSYVLGDYVSLAILGDDGNTYSLQPQLEPNVPSEMGEISSSLTTSLCSYVNISLTLSDAK